MNDTDQKLWEAKKRHHDDIQKILRGIKDELSAFEAKALAERAENLKPLATLIHDAICRYDHTEGCSWGYEIHNGVHEWMGHAHIRALELAERLHEFLTRMKYPPKMEEVEAALKFAIEHEKQFRLMEAVRIAIKS